MFTNIETLIGLCSRGYYQVSWFEASDLDFYDMGI